MKPTKKVLNRFLRILDMQDLPTLHINYRVSKAEIRTVHHKGMPVDYGVALKLSEKLKLVDYAKDGESASYRKPSK